jgi:hypothetical protein
LQELQRSLTITQDDDDSPPPPPPKSVEELLMELEAVEQKKLECEQTWEHEEETREAIRQELSEKRSSSNKSAAEDDGFVEEGDHYLEQKVQEQFDEWKDDLERHERRLSDMISCLQDELETHGFNLKEYYATTTAMPENSESSEPSWKQAADKAIMEREQEDRKQFRTTRPSSSSDDDDDDDSDAPQDIEDLGSLSEHSDNNNDNDWTSQWRHAPHKASKAKIEKAKKWEDTHLAAKRLDVVSRVTESDDRQAMIQEDRQRSRARVRRDFVVAVRQRQEKAKRNDRSAPTTPKPARDAYVDRLSSKEVRPASPEEIVDENDDPVVDGRLFGNSSFALSGEIKDQRTIAVAEPMTKLLKPHQREGIEFMFRNTFADLAYQDDQAANQAKESIGGCILAHNMGLGKTHTHK